MFSVAEVTVTIKNQGEEAYKPDEYGKSIVITRRFTKDGSTSWKIKNKDGKVISTKREELSAICDHMNIQVDNPLNVLTQGNIIQLIHTPSLTKTLDSARQFLSSSHPSDKYKVGLVHSSCFALISAPSSFSKALSLRNSLRNMISVSKISARPLRYWLVNVKLFLIFAVLFVKQSRVMRKQRKLESKKRE